jgi:hypothetical protein
MGNLQIASIKDMRLLDSVIYKLRELNKEKDHIISGIHLFIYLSI